MDDDFDRWDRFWSEYMVWVLRLVSYFCNFLFLKPVEDLVINALGAELAFEALVLVYSIVLLSVIEKTIARRFNPKYENLSMTEEQLKYRVDRERLLLSCFAYSAFNCVLGLVIGGAIGVQALDAPLVGVFVVVGTVFAVFFGIIFLVARVGESQKRQPFLYPLGIAAFLAPTWFVLYMAREVFLR